MIEGAGASAITRGPWLSAFTKAARGVAEYLANIDDRIRVGRELLRRSPVTIRVYGSPYRFAIYRKLTAPHPKFPLISSKTFGVALLDLQIPHELLYSGARFQTFQRKASTATKRNYTVRVIDPAEHIRGIIDINTSSLTRQHRAIASEYLDYAKVSQYIENPGTWYGVFDGRSELRAYCHLPIVGDCCIYSRILGHADYLHDGIMYLMLRHSIEDMHRMWQRLGYPRWAMYDMFLGGRKGLRDFKRRAGFRPERVLWRWQNWSDSDSGAATTPGDSPWGNATDKKSHTLPAEG